MTCNGWCLVVLLCQTVAHWFTIPDNRFSLSMCIQGKKFSWVIVSTENDFWDEQELMWRVFSILHVEHFYEHEQNLHGVGIFYFCTSRLS